MAADKDLFAPAPLRSMRMGLSGLQHDVLTCVCAHDRMSLVTSKGQGCRASNQRMATMVGCNFSRLCSTLTELVDLGLLKREKLGRHTVYRAIYTEADKLLFRNLSAPSTGCRSANEKQPIGCRSDRENGGNPLQTESQYIPLNGEIDSEESGEKSSAEAARFATRGLPKIEFADNAGGQMARLERALDDGAQVDFDEWLDWLAQVCEDDENEANRGRAERLADRIELLKDEDAEPGDELASPEDLAELRRSIERAARG